MNRAFIPLMRPDISAEDIAAVNRVLQTGMLVQGTEVAALEKAFAEYLKAEHVAAVSNGTATLHLALQAAGIGEGDEVIVPAFSYMATANVVELVGAKPVFVEIDIATFNIDAARIEAAITPKTKAIIPVHEFGLAADMPAIMDIARKHGLVVIEDAACALGATVKGLYTGTQGDFGSFSLHPRKAVTSGEGGILLSKTVAHHAYIQSMRNHGIEMLDGKMEFTRAGYNYRMTDFQAALVYNQFARLDGIIEKRKQIAKQYLGGIKNPKITLPAEPEGYSHTWQTFHVLCAPELDRDKLISELKEKGIGTNYGAQCMPYMAYYRDKYKLDCQALFPDALRAYKSGLALPMFERMTEEETQYIIDTVNKL